MHQYPSGPFVTELLIGYMALFSIINPFGIAFVFYARTRSLSEPERRAVARQVAFYSFVILVVSLFVGSMILRFFGISVPALRIAGGLVVALSGWSMLTASDEPPAATHAHAGVARVEDMVFFPLTIPLTTGPGSIAAAIALGAHREGNLRYILGSWMTSLLIAGLVALTIYLAYSRAAMFSRWVGLEGTRVITRLSAFLLMCVGVQIILTGLSDAFPGLTIPGRP